jgi:hypothetical protein
MGNINSLFQLIEIVLKSKRESNALCVIDLILGWELVWSSGPFILVDYVADTVTSCLPITQKQMQKIIVLI